MKVELYKTSPKIANRDLLFAAVLMAVGISQTEATGTQYQNMVYLTGILVSFAMIKAYSQMSGELLKPINICFQWIENRYIEAYKTISINVECVNVNLLGFGTNSGRLYTHTDTQYFRSRAWRV